MLNIIKECFFAILALSTGLLIWSFCFYFFLFKNDITQKHNDSLSKQINSQDSNTQNLNESNNNELANIENINISEKEVYNDNLESISTNNKLDSSNNDNEVSTYIAEGKYSNGRVCVIDLGSNDLEKLKNHIIILGNDVNQESFEYYAHYNDGTEIKVETNNEENLITFSKIIKITGKSDWDMTPLVNGKEKDENENLRFYFSTSFYDEEKNESVTKSLYKGDITWDSIQIFKDYSIVYEKRIWVENYETGELEESNFIVNIIDNVSDSEKIYDEVEVNPYFVGGTEKLNEFINKNIQYPGYAKDNEIQGKVFVEFSVMKNGSIKNAKVVKSVDKSLDYEVLRVMKLMPDWNPGKQRGKSVNCKYKLPFKFKIIKTQTEPVLYEWKISI
tara:strand:- start:47 stop:1216 length:1170 start_codon:yes stop_codon:yes gene_type:complete